MKSKRVNGAAKRRTAKAKPSRASAIGSALGCKIADALMTNGWGDKARRLQLRGEDEKDLGGLCREAVVRLVDKELDADALRRSKPALFRKIRRILKAPNGELCNAAGGSGGAQKQESK